MKRKIILFILFLLCIPCMKTNAADYELKNGKSMSGTYAGDEEDSYNYYKVTPSKDGFIAITASTSDKKPLTVDICNDNKTIIASDVEIDNKKSVLHKVSKKEDYYIRIKGKPETTYKISYKMTEFDTLTYAEKYSYTFTNASFYNKANPIILKIKAKESGNLNFMCTTDNRLIVQYLNSRKKDISSSILLTKSNLSGIGVKANKTYYIKIWNQECLTSGTTTISNMKYQITNITNSSNSSRSRSYVLSKDRYKESLVAADCKSTFWYKIKLTKDQKLSVYIESRMLQMNGSCLQLDLYNREGKKITSDSIVIDEEAYATYKDKKYKMNYPVKKITTSKLPSDTYYISIASKSKKTSGSFRIKWN